MDFNLDNKYAVPFSAPSDGRADAGFSFGKGGEDAFSVGKVGKAEKPGEVDEKKKPGGKSSPEDCETCKNRKYKDGSDESDVSFQTATHVDPSAAGAKVRAHEQEHVSNAYSKAAEAGGKVLSVGVAIHTSVCPECGRIYVSGGVTHTVIAYPNGEGGSKIESTNGDPEDKPSPAANTDGAEGASAKGSGRRAGRQDFSVGEPAQTSAISGSPAAESTAEPAPRVKAPSDTAEGVTKAAAKARVPRMNPYAAAERAAEAGRSRGAIFRARV